jgi:hypothetical protein
MHTQEVQLRTSLYSVYTSLSLRTGFDAIRSRASPFRLILLTSGCIVEYATYIARERYKVPLSGYIPLRGESSVVGRRFGTSRLKNNGWSGGTAGDSAAEHVTRKISTCRRGTSRSIEERSYWFWAEEVIQAFSTVQYRIAQTTKMTHQNAIGSLCMNTCDVTLPELIHVVRRRGVPGYTTQVTAGCTGAYVVITSNVVTSRISEPGIARLRVMRSCKGSKRDQHLHTRF